MYNKTILIGRLTARPELVKTQTDKHFTRVTLAVNRRYKNQNGQRDADFIQVVFWGRLAELLVEYADKGRLISVDGEIRTHHYEKEGDRRYVTQVLGQSFQMLESKASIDGRHQVKEEFDDVILDDMDLPF
jgi:single-strand DNA-binding protein